MKQKASQLTEHMTAALIMILEPSHSVAFSKLSRCNECFLSNEVQYTIPGFLPNSVVDGTVSDDTLRWNSVHPHDTDHWKSTEDQ